MGAGVCVKGREQVQTGNMGRHMGKRWRCASEAEEQVQTGERSQRRSLWVPPRGAGVRGVRGALGFARFSDFVGRNLRMQTVFQREVREIAANGPPGPPYVRESGRGVDRLKALNFRASVILVHMVHPILLFRIVRERERS